MTRAAITSATEALQESLHKAAAVLYQQQTPDAGAPADAGAPGGEAQSRKKGDGAVDADFEVVDDEKK